MRLKCLSVFASCCDELIEYARHEFRLSKRDDKGASLRETLKVVERMKGFTPPEAVNPCEFPVVLWDLWQHFLILNASRGAGMAGASPITQLDLFAYSQLHRVVFEGWMLEAIRRLDRIALSDDPMKD
jgi:hypothetical protein